MEYQDAAGLIRISHRRKPPARHALLPQSFAAKVSARCWRTLLKIALRLCSGLALRRDESQNPEQATVSERVEYFLGAFLTPCARNAG